MPVASVCFILSCVFFVSINFIKAFSSNLNKSQGQLYEYHELKTGKKIKIGMNYRNIYKPINVLWQTPNFTKLYNPNNTFIIDDLADMFVHFPENIILIPGWCHLNWSDDNLKLIIDELEKYNNSKKRKSIKDMCQNINSVFRQDIWQDINSSECQDYDFKPEFYYKKSITKKNQKLLLKQEKVGVSKGYSKKRKQSTIKQNKQNKQIKQNKNIVLKKAKQSNKQGKKKQKQKKK